MECPAQARLVVYGLFSMAFSATLALRGFIGQSLSIIVNMMTFTAFLDPGGFIVIIMSKNSRRSPLLSKTIALNHHHILLSKYR
jgi:hypothetical protein